VKVKFIWPIGARSMRYSVIRRSVYSIIFFAGGIFFNYLLVLIANLELPAEGFGVFYLGWALINIFVTPGTTLVLYLAAHFASVFRRGGPPALMSASASVRRTFLPWLVGAVLGLQVVLYFAGTILGSTSVALSLLLPVTAASFIVVEAVRAVFQGMLRFLWAGLSWLVWSAARCGLGALGLIQIGTPLGGFLGMLAANGVALITLFAAIQRITRQAISDGDPSDVRDVVVSMPLSDALFFCVMLGGIILLNFADVMVAYVALTRVELGAYTAAAVVPKAMVTLTQPIVQIMLPVVAHIRSEARSVRAAILKSAGAALAMGIVSIGILWVASGAVCGGHYGIRSCDPSLMLMLMLAAIPVSVLRVLMVADASIRRYWGIALSVGGAMLFSIVALLRETTAFNLASEYMIVCGASLSAYVLVGTWRRGMQMCLAL
jgi:hypothetical protein